MASNEDVTVRIAGQRTRGEEHWQIAAIGISAKGSSPADIWDRMLGYFQWCMDNPIDKPQVQNGKATLTYAPRPFNEAALCLHCGITREYLHAGLKSKDEDYKAICTKALMIIEAQILEYAMVGVFNPIVGVKKLGLDTEDKPPPVTPNIVIQVNAGEAPKLLTAEPVDMGEVVHGELMDEEED